MVSITIRNLDNDLKRRPRIREAGLRRGAALPSQGKRRDRLMAEIDAMVSEDFAGRTLPFDSAAMATRNLGDFAGRSAGVIDPWRHPGGD